MPVRKNPRNRMMVAGQSRNRQRPVAPIAMKGYSKQRSRNSECRPQCGSRRTDDSFDPAESAAAATNPRGTPPSGRRRQERGDFASRCRESYRQDSTSSANRTDERSRSVSGATALVSGVAAGASGAVAGAGVPAGAGEAGADRPAGGAGVPVGMVLVGVGALTGFGWKQDFLLVIYATTSHQLYPITIASRETCEKICRVWRHWCADKIPDTDRRLNH
jgi:hypothetical protein